VLWVSVKIFVGAACNVYATYTGCCGFQKRHQSSLFSKLFWFANFVWYLIACETADNRSGKIFGSLGKRLHADHLLHARTRNRKTLFKRLSPDIWHAGRQIYFSREKNAFRSCLERPRLPKISRKAEQVDQHLSLYEATVEAVVESRESKEDQISEYPDVRVILCADCWREREREREWYSRDKYRWM